MNFQKNIFFNQWKKSLKRNKNVVAVVDSTTEITVWFARVKPLHHKIRMWLIDNNYEFEDLDYADGRGWQGIILKCPF
jgi:hypothetical protein